MLSRPLCRDDDRHRIPSWLHCICTRNAPVGRGLVPVGVVVACERAVRARISSRPANGTSSLGQPFTSDLAPDQRCARGCPSDRLDQQQAETSPGLADDRRQARLRELVRLPSSHAHPSLPPRRSYHPAHGPRSVNNRSTTRSHASSVSSRSLRRRARVCGRRRLAVPASGVPPPPDRISSYVVLWWLMARSRTLAVLSDPSLGRSDLLCFRYSRVDGAVPSSRDDAASASALARRARQRDRCRPPPATRDRPRGSKRRRMVRHKLCLFPVAQMLMSA